MAEFRRPGVFVKEVPTPPIPPVAAPSALGIVGFTKKGPADKAVRIESFDDFRDIFGGYTPLSLVPLILEKYFNNGGQVAYVVRITPVGSKRAEGRFLGSVSYQNGLAFGNGTSVLFSGTIPNAPLAKGKLVLTLQGDGTAGPYVFTVPGGFNPHTLAILADSQRAVDEPGAFPNGNLVGSVTASSVNYQTGAVSVTFSAVVPTGTDINVYVTTVQIRSIDSAGNDLIAFDDGNGNLVGDVDIIGPNTINYLTGAFDIHFNAAPDGGAVVHLRNDLFGAAGNVAITETVADPGFVVAGMSGGSDYAPAVGSITAIAGALLNDGETFTIDDGVNPAVTFEFDSGGGVTPGNVPVPFTPADTDLVVAANIRSAINTAANLRVKADPVFSYATRDRWLFEAQSEGLWGNDIKVEIAGSPNFRRQQRAGDFTPPFLATGDGTAGPYSFTIPNAPLIPGSVIITAAGYEAHDDGNGTLLGDVISGTVNYETGATSVTFSGVVPVGAAVRASQHGFEFYDVSVSEYQEDTKEWLIQEVFEAVEMVDSEAADFLTRVINDDQQGSSYVRATLGEGGRLPSLVRTVYKQTIGTGDGTTRRFTGTLSNPPVDPFSVKVFVGTPFQEALDDGVGNLFGTNVDPFGANRIDYRNGTIDVTFKQPPAAAQSVTVVYALQRESDSVQLEGGTDGTGVLTRSQIAVPGLEAQRKGVYAFNSVEDPLNIVVPDFAESALVLQDLIAFAEAKRKRFIIGTTAKGLSPTQAVNFRRNDIRSNSSFVGVYYPWVKSLDRSINKTRTIPPIGHVAGVYSRVDRTRSEGKAPAGIVDGLLLDVVGVERFLEPKDIELVFPTNLNTIVLAAGIGIYVNGARTLSNDRDFRYVNVRRVFIAITARAESSLRFALFEPIGPALFSRVKAALTGIALEYFQKGALAGTNPREAFDVVVDELNTPELAEQGIVKARLAIAPTKPAEFIVVELSIKQREGAVTVTTV